MLHAVTDAGVEKFKTEPVRVISEFVKVHRCVCVVYNQLWQVSSVMSLVFDFLQPHSSKSMVICIYDSLYNGPKGKV